MGFPFAVAVLLVKAVLGVITVDGGREGIWMGIWLLLIGFLDHVLSTAAKLNHEFVTSLLRSRY